MITSGVRVPVRGGSVCARGVEGVEVESRSGEKWSGCVI
jgi:hypothetical protein